jgi:hypothetical protein
MRSQTHAVTRTGSTDGRACGEKVSKDVSMFAPEIQKTFRALKTCGRIGGDNGSDTYITGRVDPRWNNDALNPAFHAVYVDEFEVVQLESRGSLPIPSRKVRLSR